VTLHDVIGSQPNTGSLTIINEAVDVGSAIEIGLGDFTATNLLFGGLIQARDETYVSRPTQPCMQWPVTLIDYTFALNRRRPIISYVGESATSLVKDLMGRFAPPGYTTNHVQDGLPAVTINFDGSEPLMSCIAQVATQINGRAKIDYARDLHFFIPPESGLVPPDSITIVNPPLNDPPISFHIDLSQVRTRVIGRGAGSQTPVDVGANETIIPLADVAMFTATGGRAVGGITDAGAKGQPLTYTGIRAGGGGTIVGPGASPTAAPSVAGQQGTGLLNGSYWYAYTWVTAAGETTPGPIGAINTGPFAPPSSHPTLPAAATAGPGPDAGSHRYGITFVSGSGETTVLTSSNSVTTSNDATPGPPGTAAQNGGNNSGLWPVGAQVAYVMTYIDPAGVETGIGPPSNTVVATVGSGGTFAQNIQLSNVPMPTPGTTQAKRIYRNVNGAWTGRAHLSTVGSDRNWAQDGVGADFTQGTFTPPQTGIGLPRRTVAITGIQIGPAGITARRLYRSRANQTDLFLVTTINDNTTTSYTDTTADAALGVAPPPTNTTAANQVVIYNVATGPSSVTSRKIYRTAVNSSQLKLLLTIADNTTTGNWTDAAADGTLGANAPTSNTSGLTQVTGQVLAGSTSIPTAGTAPFASTGGWVITGQQVIRYTGVSGNSLTGIPATGPGSIITTIPYNTQISPAPVLLGVTGVLRGMARGSAVHILVQRDNVTAQIALGQLERDSTGAPTDGIREYMIVDERRSEPSLIAVCDADLATFADPTIGVTYQCRDPRTRAGSIVGIALASGAFSPNAFNPGAYNTGWLWGYSGYFLISEVTITFDPAPQLYPRYAVTATSNRFTFADLLQRVFLRTV